MHCMMHYFILTYVNITLLQHHCFSKIYKIKVDLNWTVETKVIIVLCYYVILGTAVLTIFTVALVNLNPRVFLDYFACERQGLPPLNSNITTCEEPLLAIKKVIDPISSTAAIVILGFLPVVNLVYVVKLRDLKNKIKTYSQTRFVHHVQKEPQRSAIHYVPYNEHRNTILSCNSMTVRNNNITTKTMVTSHMNKDLRN